MGIGNAVVTMLAGLILLASAPAQAQGNGTAAEVTDRATLKAFVEKARGYLSDMATVRDIAQMGHDFRVDGPWNAGDMFLITMTRERRGAHARREPDGGCQGSRRRA